MMENFVGERKRFDDITFKRFIKLLPFLGAVIYGSYYVTTYKNRVDDLMSRMEKLESKMDTIADNTDRLVSELLDKK